MPKIINRDEIVKTHLKIFAKELLAFFEFHYKEVKEDGTIICECPKCHKLLPTTQTSIFYFGERGVAEKGCILKIEKHFIFCCNECAPVLREKFGISTIDDN